MSNCKLITNTLITDISKINQKITIRKVHKCKPYLLKNINYKGYSEFFLFLNPVSICLLYG